jgi:hypothetical protein
MKKNEPLLTLRTGKVNLTLPVGKAAWMLWRIASYPLQLVAAYYLFGMPGLLFTVILQITNNRGQL